MAINPQYIPAFSIETVILDKDTGAPLSGGLVYFNQADQPNLPMPVWQISGTDPNYTFTQLPNPMTLSSIGTFVDSLGNPVVPYFYPYDSEGNIEYYYIIVTSSMGVPQFIRNPVPYIPMGQDMDVLSIIDNELSNPQFSQVLFPTTSSTYTYNFTTGTNQVVTIAPNWDIVVTCASNATVIVSQVTPPGELNIITNPPTVLSISSSGVTTLLLRQRLFGIPGLWSGGNVSASFVAKTDGGAAVPLTLNYSQSNGLVVGETLVTASLLASGTYEQFPGTLLIPASDSADTFPNGYVDIYFNIAPSSNAIYLTSVMLAYTGTAVIDEIDYEQTTQARQIDHLFHYYQPQLNFKPIPSFLVGWDFPLNPSQCNGDSVGVTTATNAYTWDQTILYQTVVSSMSTSRASNGAMVITASGGTGQAAIIQYLPKRVAQQILENILSVNVNANTNQSDGLIGTVSLWYTTNTSPIVPALPASLITTLDANGHPSAVVSGWTEITRTNQMGNAQFTLQSALANYGFSGFNMPGTSIPTTATAFAIVVGFASLASGNNATFNSISVVPGLIPTIPAPQTFDEVIRECEHYYECSQPVGTAEGTAGTSGLVVVPQAAESVVGAGTALTYASPFCINYRTVKRVAPSTTSVRLYDPSNTLNGVQAILAYANTGGTFTLVTGAAALVNFWGTYVASSKAVFWEPITINAIKSTTGSSGSITYSSGAISFNYAIDCRMGIV